MAAQAGLSLPLSQSPKTGFLESKLQYHSIRETDTVGTGPGSSVGRVSASGEWEVTGLIPGRDIPKSLKMFLASPRLALRLMG